MFIRRSLLWRVTIIYQIMIEKYLSGNQHGQNYTGYEIKRDLSPPYFFHLWIFAVMEQIQQCDRLQIKAIQFLFSTLLSSLET